MKKSQVTNIIKEEIENVKWGRINEQLEPDDVSKIRAIIRKEVSSIFFELFKKRKTWGA
jgi:hypothetical protein